MEAVRNITAFQLATSTRFVWRGAANADWGLHSSLVRAYQAQHGRSPDERRLRAFESAVLQEAYRWGLDWHPAGVRLSALELLATLQHYGIPTRLLDFTFDPFIALWFAVERVEEDGAPGRVFAIDIADQSVPRDQALAANPWWIQESPNTDGVWCTRPWIWTPPPLEPRMVRQKGCFLMGGVPSTQPPRNLRAGVPRDRPMQAEEIRKSMTVPVVLINYVQAEAAAAGTTPRGRPPRAGSFTLKIAADKRRLREELDQLFDLGHRSMFPDFPGLAQYGSTWR